METAQELIPLAKDLMAQKPTSKLVKLYVLGSVLALFGAVLGLVETVCSPFSAASRLREEEAAVAELRAARERRAPCTQVVRDKGHRPELCGRAPSHRQHAS